jgi:hypothetical protein
MRDFDTLAGVDAWQLCDDRGFMRSIASRVQEGDWDYRTFTIRKSRPNGAKTEFAKRMEAIKNQSEGALYPALTIHAYVENYRSGSLMSAAAVYTVDLYKYLEIQISEGWAKTKRNRGDNTEFYYVSWKELAESEARIYEWLKNSEH